MKMTKTKKINAECKKSNSCCNIPGSIYGLAFIGAVIYYIQTANTFWQGVLGILKALVWPAILIHKLFVFFGM